MYCYTLSYLGVVHSLVLIFFMCTTGPLPASYWTNFSCILILSSYSPNMSLSAYIMLTFLFWLHFSHLLTAHTASVTSSWYEASLYASWTGVSSGTGLVYCHWCTHADVWWYHLMWMDLERWCSCISHHCLCDCGLIVAWYITCSRIRVAIKGGAAQPRSGKLSLLSIYTEGSSFHSHKGSLWCTEAAGTLTQRHLSHLGLSSSLSRLWPKPVQLHYQSTGLVNTSTLHLLTKESAACALT